MGQGARVIRGGTGAWLGPEDGAGGLGESRGRGVRGGTKCRGGEGLDRGKSSEEWTGTWGNKERGSGVGAVQAQSQPL